MVAGSALLAGGSWGEQSSVTEKAGLQLVLRCWWISLWVIGRHLGFRAEAGQVGVLTAAPQPDFLMPLPQGLADP